MATGGGGGIVGEGERVANYARLVFDSMMVHKRNKCPPIINAPLCFVINKRGKIPAKEMKELLYNFYTREQINEVLEILH